MRPRSTRLGIAILLILTLAVLAGQRAAGASRSAQPPLSAPEKGHPAFAAAKDPDCEKDEQGKDKDKCKSTVKTPPSTLIIPVTGSYSVGGFCVLDVELNDPPVRLDATVITPLPAKLPEGLKEVDQGCLLTYFRANEQLLTLLPVSGNTTICFGAFPQEETTVYFHNTYAETPEWTPLETTVQAGIACAPANESGTYVATYRNP